MRFHHFVHRRLSPFLLILTASAVSAAPAQHAASAATLAWFQKTEQALMDAVAPGDKAPWDRILDESYVVTSEEGELLTRQPFLDAIRPLPAGLSGSITVRDLTVQEFPSFAVVRYLGDEVENVFGQRLTTQYRITDTFVRAGSSWKMVASHTAVVTQDPPAQAVASEGWPAFVGTYKLVPEGWTFRVALRDGKLYGGRDPAKLKAFIPLTPDAFVLSGSLGEWMFVMGQDGKASRILDFRKFEPLVWTRIAEP
jgi:hypothetical protein